MTREELLEAAEAAIHDKSINVTAIKLLLDELRRDQDEGKVSEFDDLDNVTPIRPARAA